MKFTRVLQNDAYWPIAHKLAKESQIAWLCSCGLQSGFEVTQLFRTLPDAQVLIGVPVRDDTARDLERSRNAIRYAQKLFPKLRFREYTLIHYKFHIFYPKHPAEQPTAFIGSMNLTAGHWEELMVEVDYETTEELQSLFERLWRNAKEVSPHSKTLLKNLEARIVRGPFSNDA